LGLRERATRPLPMGDEYGGFLLLNIFDLFLTGHIFHHGGREVNPVGIRVMDHYGMSGFVLFKFASVAIVVLISEAVFHIKPSRARSLMTAANLIYFGVILWECVLLLMR
jgi:hypothetical protein